MKINVCSVIISRWNTAQPKCNSCPPINAIPPIISISANRMNQVFFIDSVPLMFIHSVRHTVAAATTQNQAGICSPKTELSPTANQADPAVNTIAINMKISSGIQVAEQSQPQ